MSTLAPIRKTRAMLALEDQNEGKDIRNLILDAIRLYSHNVDAASHIGITESTLSHWIFKLGLSEEIEDIRKR